MDIKKIRQIFKKYIYLLEFGKKNSRSRIYYHWEIILVIFIILNFLLLSFSLYIFLQINEGGIFLVRQNKEVRIGTINRGTLQELLTSFEIRDTLFNERKTSYPKLQNPSR